MVESTAAGPACAVVELPESPTLAIAALTEKNTA
jgi:hypothetical protein